MTVQALTIEEKKILARCSCGHLIASHDGDDGAGCMAALEEEPWVECHCPNSERQAEVAGLNEFAEHRIAAAGQQVRDAVLAVVPEQGSLVVLRMPEDETPEDIPWAHLHDAIPGARFLVVADDVDVATIPRDELQPELIKLLESEGEDLLGERYTHFIPAGDAALEVAHQDGTPITALCGKLWVPSRDPAKFELCPECIKRLRSTWAA